MVMALRKYPTCGAAVGLIEVIDAAALYCNRGVAGGISFALSGIEFVWAIVSLVVIFRVKHRPTRVLALVFFSYNALGWASSIFLIHPPALPSIPLWFVIAGGIFGLGYAAGSLYVASKP
jgi:hypothetical protein